MSISEILPLIDAESGYKPALTSGLAPTLPFLALWTLFAAATALRRFPPVVLALFFIFTVPLVLAVAELDVDSHSFPLPLELEPDDEDDDEEEAVVADAIDNEEAAEETVDEEVVANDDDDDDDPPPAPNSATELVLSPEFEVDAYRSAFFKNGDGKFS
ncbi:hypothetical protein H1R20_g15085, partial [Candolleomyces eurysporus]